MKGIQEIVMRASEPRDASKLGLNEIYTPINCLMLSYEALFLIPTHKSERLELFTREYDFATNLSRNTSDEKPCKYTVGGNVRSETE